MSKSATELAHMIERYNAGVHSQAIFEDYLEAAKMLRTQHKQIEQLREALQGVLHCPAIHDVYGDDKDEETHEAERIARKALEQTK